MAGVVEGISTINSFIRTLLAVAVVGGAGTAGWFGYTTFRAKDVANRELAEAMNRLERAEAEVASLTSQLRLKDEQIAKLEASVKKLETALHYLKIDHRVARFTAVDQYTDNAGQVSTEIEFVELDDDGQPVDQPRRFRIQGDQVYIDGWVVKFEDQYVEEADIERGTSLLLFKRIFGSGQRPDDGHVLDEAGARAKLRYQQEQQGEPSWKETVENWKRAAANEDQLISYELRSLEDSFFAVEVTKDDVDEVIARWTGVPVSSVKQKEAEKLLRIEDALHERIVSQRPAISALARAIRRSRAGLKNPGRPVGSFLFLGPTGVGKTEVARSIAEYLFGSEKSLIRFDMSEFMEKHSVSKFIGSPPGYVGHEDGGQLTEKLRRSPYAVVLFDEIEKAHPDLFNILLQVFEDGVLTDSQGQSVDCKHAIFIMTSNLGARVIQKRASLGFQSGADASRQRIEDEVMQRVKQTFQPEFINRLDEIIIFDELADDDLLRIVDLQVDRLNCALHGRELKVVLTDAARRWLVDKTCADRKYGARPLKRAMQKHIEDELSEALIQGHLSESGTIEVSPTDGRLAFRALRTNRSGAEKKLSQKA